MLKSRTRLLTAGAALAAALLVGPAAALPVFASGTNASTAASASSAGPVPPPPGVAGRPGPGPGPRPGSGPGRPGPGLDGTITALSASGFTMTRAGTTYTVAVSSSTAYQLGPGWSTTQASLAAGDRVTVQGTVSGQQVSAAAVIDHLWGVTAQVTTLTGNAASVTQPTQRTATVQFASTPGSLAVGNTVQAVGTWEGDTLIARAWRVVPDHADGIVTALAGSSGATVKTADGKTVTVDWSASTTFTAGPGTSAGPSAIAVGTVLHAKGTLTANTLEATDIHLGPAPGPRPAGA